MTNKSYNLECHIFKSSTEGSSSTDWVLKEGLEERESERLANLLNNEYKKVYPKGETDFREVTVDFCSGRTKLIDVMVRREYRKVNSDSELKSLDKREAFTKSVEEILNSNKKYELFGLLGRIGYFYTSYFGGYCKYHGC